MLDQTLMRRVSIREIVIRDGRDRNAYVLIPVTQPIAAQFVEGEVQSSRGSAVARSSASSRMNASELKGHDLARQRRR